MTDYAKLKKIEEESLEKLKEGTGPVDECICSLISPPIPEEKKSFVDSVRKAFASLGSKRRTENMDDNLDFNDTGSIPRSNGIHSTKELIKRHKSCGKCGCDSEKFVLKHSDLSIRITTPDISSICPCSTNCLPDKEKLQNNIQVIVEHANVTSGPLGQENGAAEEIKKEINEQINENNIDEDTEGKKYS